MTEDETSGLLRGIAIDKRKVLAEAMLRLMKAGFGYNSAPAGGVVSMERAWQGADEDSVVVDVITFDTRGQALAAREGVDGLSTWGPNRGGCSDVVDALLSQAPPVGYQRVAARSASAPAVDVTGESR